MVKTEYVCPIQSEVWLLSILDPRPPDPLLKSQLDEEEWGKRTYFCFQKKVPSLARG